MAYDFYHEENKRKFDNIQTTDPYDDSHKSSMINMAPPWLQSRMRNANMIKYMSLSEEDLEEKVKPTLTLKRLRTSFWREYEMLHRNFGNRATAEKGISLYRVCVGICTNGYFADKVATNDLFLSWIIRPPVNYEIAMEESLQYGLNRMREILNFPLYQGKYNKDGLPVCDKYTGEQVLVPDEKIANLLLKTVAFLDLRVKGAVPQKIQQYTEMHRKSVNYNVKHDGNANVTVDVEKLDNKLLTIDDLDSKIAKLSQETQKLVDDPSYSSAEKKLLVNMTESELDKHAIEVSSDNS